MEKLICQQSYFLCSFDNMRRNFEPEENKNNQTKTKAKEAILSIEERKTRRDNRKEKLCLNQHTHQENDVKFCNGFSKFE